MIGIVSVSYGIAHSWTPQNLPDDKSTMEYGNRLLVSDNMSLLNT